MNNELDLEALKAIKDAINKKGLKKKHVAESIGVERETFSLVLSGKRRLGRSALMLLSQVLEIDLAVLVKQAS